MTPPQRHALIKGERGMAGSAIGRRMVGCFIDVYAPMRAELDVLDQPSANGYLLRLRPDYISAAKAAVGGNQYDRATSDVLPASLRMEHKASRMALPSKLSGKAAHIALTTWRMPAYVGAVQPNRPARQLRHRRGRDDP